MARVFSADQRKKYLRIRHNFKSPVIGVTGSVGKSAVIEMINTVLEQHGKVLKNQRGHGDFKTNVSLFEKLSSRSNYAIFEFDFIRHQSFAEILSIIKPDIGIVTNIGDAHLSYIGGMIDVALQRSEVVRYLARDGTAILNKDDELSSALSEYINTKNIIKFGLSQTADYYAKNIEHLGPLGTRFVLNDTYDVTIPIYSISDVYNFLAATATLVTLGIPVESIISTFQQKFELPPGRGKLHKLNGHYLIDESYDATPRSVAKAARSLVGFKPYADRLIYIIGDMMESGPNVEERHLNMGYFLSALPVDFYITIGPYAEFIGKGISLIRSKGKTVVSCQSINQILETLDRILTEKAVISIQGVGQVAVRRVLNYLEKKENNA